MIAVTRFPHDAAERYSRENDYELWKEKLHIYGVDLRHLPSVNEFIAHVLNYYDRIDIYSSFFSFSYPFFYSTKIC